MTKRFVISLPGQERPGASVVLVDSRPRGTSFCLLPADRWFCRRVFASFECTVSFPHGYDGD